MQHRYVNLPVSWLLFFIPVYVFNKCLFKFAFTKNVAVLISM